MFETVTRPTRPGVFGELMAFCIHQVVAGPFALLGAMLTVWPGVALIHFALRVVAGAPVRSAEVATNIFAAAWGGLVAWLLGRLAGRITPIWAPFGRFVWVLPAAVMFLLVVSDVRRLGTPYASDLRGYLGFSSVELTNLSFWLVTLPLVLSLGYAWGLQYGARCAKCLRAQGEVASEASVDGPLAPGH